jgi:hypothetical protein
MIVEPTERAETSSAAMLASAASMSEKLLFSSRSALQKSFCTSIRIYAVCAGSSRSSRVRSSTSSLLAPCQPRVFCGKPLYACFNSPSVRTDGLSCRPAKRAAINISASAACSGNTRMATSYPRVTASAASRTTSPTEDPASKTVLMRALRRRSPTSVPWNALPPCLMKIR